MVVIVLSRLCSWTRHLAEEFVHGWRVRHSLDLRFSDVYKHDAFICSITIQIRCLKGSVANNSRNLRQRKFPCCPHLPCNRWARNFRQGIESVSSDRCQHEHVPCSLFKSCASLHGAATEHRHFSRELQSAIELVFSPPPAPGALRRSQA